MGEICRVTSLIALQPVQMNEKANFRSFLSAWTDIASFNLTKSLSMSVLCSESPRRVDRGQITWRLTEALEGDVRGNR